MNNRRKLQRKIIIASCMALLLLPMSYLAQPAASDEAGDSLFEGKLAQMRSEHRLAQSNLGEIDPTSEAMKLACLGLRGVYATWLWHKSNQFKEQENWSSLAATLEQMTKLQPNFVSVWRFQGWNQAYNLSVEMDDYRYRYYWVTRGIEFIDRGQDYNEKDLMLLWDEGWTTAQKIGRADEVEQFRRMFAEDEFQMVANLFGTDKIQDWRNYDQMDNWYVGRESFLDACQLYDNDPRGVDVRRSLRQNVAVFMSEPTKCLMRFAMAREKEGQIGDNAADRWSIAFGEWTDGSYPSFGASNPPQIQRDQRLNYMYGVRPFAFEQGVPETTFLGLDAAIRRRDELVLQMVGGSEEIVNEIIQDKIDEQVKLAAEDTTGAQLLQLDILRRGLEDFDSLTANEKNVAAEALPFAEVTPDEVLRHPAVADDNASRDRINELLPDARKAQQEVDAIRRGISLVNYTYWRERCESEASPLGLSARRDLYDAQQAFNDDMRTRARELYESGFQKWRELIDGDENRPSYYRFTIDAETGHDMLEHARRYQEILNNENLPFPDDFPIKDVINNRNPQPPFWDEEPGETAGNASSQDNAANDDNNDDAAQDDNSTQGGGQQEPPGGGQTQTGGDGGQ